MPETHRRISVLVTGGCGFIGHHFVEYLLKNTEWRIFILDKLRYASNGLDRLRDLNALNKGRVLVRGRDFAHPLSERLQKEMQGIEYLFHLGAKMDVDRSIENPEPFVISNVVGTMRMLDFARKLPRLKRFFYFSTGEVYGPAPEGVCYKEWDRPKPGNPYAATKAGADSLCVAYHHAYGVPVVITNCMNVFGERMSPEKFIPMTIKKLLAGEKILIHADTMRTKPGSRCYIHARSVSAAILFLIGKGEVGEKYNIVGERDVTNLELAQLIADTMSAPLAYEMIDFHSSRPGHDLRFALDGTKMAELGWKLPTTFEESLKQTVRWTLKNRRWLPA